MTSLAPEFYLSESSRLLSNGDEDAAERVLREGEERYPDDIALFFRRSYLLEAKQSDEENQARWALAIVRFPHVADGYVHAARLASKANQHEAAEKILGTASLLFVNSRPILFQSAYSAAIRHDYYEAEKRWLTALDAFPGDEQATEQLARVRNSLRLRSTSELAMTLGRWKGSDQGFSESIDRRTPGAFRLSFSTPATRYPPRLVSDPFSTGLGEFVKEPARINVEGQRVLLAPNSSIFGQRMLISEQQIYSDLELTDEIVSEYMDGHRDISPVEIGFEAVSKSNCYRTLDFRIDRAVIDEPVVLLTSSEPINYGAWLIRVLPKLFYARDVLVDDRVKYLIYCERVWQRKILSFLGIKTDSLVSQSFSKSYFSPLAIVPSWPNNTGFLDGRSIGMVHQIRAKASVAYPAFRGPKAIYVSRSKFDSGSKRGEPRIRPFPQELELEQRLLEIGVIPFAPEEHSFEESLLTFANAELVVGRQGAGMFNVIFCREGTKVIDIEHLPHFLRGHCNMFASCQLDYSLVLGKTQDVPDSHPIHKGLAIDIQATVRLVQEQL